MKQPIDIDRPRRALVSAMAVVAGVHAAFLACGGATSGDLVVALAGWLMVVLLFARDAGNSAPDAAGWASGIAGIFLTVAALTLLSRAAGFDLWFLKIAPFPLLAGLLLLGGGWCGLISNWRPLAILLIVIAPEKLLGALNYDGALLLAHTRIAGFILHCFGAEPVLHGNIITLPTGTVEVQEACSGLVLMLLLLKIALMVALAFPIRLALRFMMCTAALLTGFAVGVLRIALLAAIVHRQSWFDKLHGSLGMNLFPLAGFVLFLPFLYPAEGPFADLLRAVRSRWNKPRGTMEAGGWRAVYALAVAGTMAGCLVKSLLLPSPASFLPAEMPAALFPADRMEKPESCPVPENLRACRFDALRDARRVTARGIGTLKTTMVCSVSAALAAPEELVRKPEIARFLNDQGGGAPVFSTDPAKPVAWMIAKKSNDEFRAVAMVPGGIVKTGAFNADGASFFSASEYAAAQQAAFFKMSTWRDFFRSGRPLKDLRYWLVVKFERRD